MKRLEPVPAGIAVDRRAPVKSSRSTVATMADIQPYLAALFLREARPVCPEHGVEGTWLDTEKAAERIASVLGSRRAVMTYSISLTDAEQYLELRDSLVRDGLRRAYQGGKVIDLDTLAPSRALAGGGLEVVVDRLVPARDPARLAQGIEAGWQRSSGLVSAHAESESVSVLLNLGDATFPPPRNFPAGGSQPHSVAAGDLDGDGDIDLSVANIDPSPLSNHSVFIMFNTGRGDFGPPTALALASGSVPSTVRAGDLDSDGDLDLATANMGSHDVSVFQNRGDGSFETRADHRADDEPRDLALGDIDGDLDLDIAVANGRSGKLSVLTNQGDGTFADQLLFPVQAVPESVVIADLDDDLDADLAAANQNSSSITLLFNRSFPPASLDADRNGVRRMRA
jgi:hypothetical protein